jgi:hypothetical protein
VTSAGGNGHVRPGVNGALDGPALDDDGADATEAALDALDEEPLDADEAAAGAAVAGDEVDESLDERIAAVIDELPDVEHRQDGDAMTYAVGGRTFARVGDDTLEAALDPAVAKAAFRTPDTAASSTGAGWVIFTPRIVDRYALDRAEAWVRLAHRRAGGR